MILALPGAATAADQRALVTLTAPGTQPVEFLTPGFSWSLVTPSPYGSGGGASALTLNALTVSKPVDAFSTFLFNSAATGRRFAKLTLDVYDGAGTLVLTLTFEDVYIASIAHQGSDMTKEAVSFGYRSVSESVGMSTSYVAGAP